MRNGINWIGTPLGANSLEANLTGIGIVTIMRSDDYGKLYNSMSVRALLTQIGRRNRTSSFQAIFVETNIIIILSSCDFWKAI